MIYLNEVLLDAYFIRISFVLLLSILTVEQTLGTTWIYLVELLFNPYWPNLFNHIFVNKFYFLNSALIDLHYYFPFKFRCVFIPCHSLQSQIPLFLIYNFLFWHQVIQWRWLQSILKAVFLPGKDLKGCLAASLGCYHIFLYGMLANWVSPFLFCVFID